MRKIELKVSHADLMGEVAKWGYTIGENIPDEQSKARHFIQGPTDPGHHDLLKAVADDAWAECLQVMSAYTVDGQCPCGCDDDCCDYKCGCGDGLGTDDANEVDSFDTQWCNDYEITLWLPDNTYPTIVTNIPRLVRRYMTMRMRAEWETLTKQDPSISTAQAEQAIRRLKVEISTRTTVGKTKGSWRYGY